nr:MAG TPA: hypothetical protein [Caudoviricetes sp.]
MTDSAASPDFSLTHPDAAPQRARFISEPEQVAGRMKELAPGLTPEMFRDVLTQGINARSVATGAHPPTAGGTLQWIDTVAALRTILSAQDWQIRNVRNSPLIVSPDQSLAIVPMTGSPETGQSEALQPTNRAEKGAVTGQYVKGNQEQYLLFARQAAEHQGMAVWVLLYCYDRDRDEVRAELSLPADFDGRYISSWLERLVLPPIQNLPADFDNSIDDTDGPDADFDIEPLSGTL